MRQECAMTTIDNRAVLEQVEGGFVSLPVCTLDNTNIVHYPGCPPYLPCPPPPPCWSVGLRRICPL
jgi:hypothetical protein